MTQALDTLSDVAGRYAAIVFDQWGVLHDGTSPYPGAVGALAELSAAGHRLAVLSNSGKRAAPNQQRIAAMGFDASVFDTVMTSGEALWRDIASGRVKERVFYPIERAAGDALAWAEGLEIVVADHMADAEALLVMGLPDGATLADWQPNLDRAAARDMPLYCSNPDKKSPRADGLVISPGAVAARYSEMGQAVVLYGKPHLPIFQSVARALGTDDIVMVGDSLEHDIAGAHAAGWDSVLIQGGLYAAEFRDAAPETALANLTASYDVAAPTFRMETLR